MTRLDMDPEDRRSHIPPPPSRRRGRFGIAVKAVAAALAVAVLAWGVRYGNDYFTAPSVPSGPVPVIGPDAGPVKVVPDNPGGVTVPDQDKVILNGDNAQPKVEQLLPPPETPVASPAAPPVPPQVQAAPPVQLAPQAQQVQPAPAPAPPPATAPKQQAAAAPPPQKPAMAPAKPAASGNLSAAPTGPAAQTLPPGKGYFLQLGALRTVEAAQASWTRLKTAQPDILGNLPANAVRIDLGGDRGVFYRVMAGPISDESSAERSCNTLKQRHVACIPVKP